MQCSRKKDWFWYFGGLWGIRWIKRKLSLGDNQLTNLKNPISNIKMFIYYNYLRVCDLTYWCIKSCLFMKIQFTKNLLPLQEMCYGNWLNNAPVPYILKVSRIYSYDDQKNNLVSHRVNFKRMRVFWTNDDSIKIKIEFNFHFF